MKNLLFLFALVLSLVLSSCAITNEVHFNKDYSGNYALNLDMGDLIEMAKSFDPSMEDTDIFEDALPEETRAELDAMVSSVEGISNAKYDLTEDYQFVISFDFEDIDALNGFFEQLSENLAESEDMMDEDMMAGLDAFQMPQFTKEGKVISYTANVPTDMLDMATEEGGEMGDMMDMVTGMMDYSVIMTFDRKVKSVDLDGVDLMGQDKHSVKTRVDMEKFYETGSYTIAVKVK